ncbi:MAG: hypothetical protein DCC71_21540 [Proteobacteria bacterium]|nr:MAG: hypothetical protein DCC71_21540 [Pseudomonadota bacterium]
MRRISRGSAYAAAVLATGALVGFATGERSLASLSRDLSPMKPNSAIAALALAGTITALASPAFVGLRRVAARLASWIALAIAAATLSEFAFDWELGIDELLFHDPWSAANMVRPGRPAPASSIAIAMLAVSLLLSARGLAYAAAQALAIAGGSIGALALVGYLFRAKALYAFQSHAQVGPSTALTLLLLAIGALAAVPDRGVAGLAAADSVGGRLTRRLLPYTIGVPLVLAVAMQLAVERGLLGPQLALALVVVSSTGILGAVVLRTASSIHRLDSIRRRSEALLRESTGRVRHLSALVDASSAAIVSFDELGRVVTWNPRAERVFGRRSADAIGRRASDALAFDTARAVPPLLEQVLRRGETRRLELRFESSRGERIAGTLTLTPLLDWERRTVGACAVLEERDPADVQARASGS